MINKYREQYKVYFKSLLEHEFSDTHYPPFNHEIELSEKELKQKQFQLDSMEKLFDDEIETLKKIGEVFCKVIKKEYDNKEMDFVEFYSIAIEKAKEISNGKYVEEREAINKMDFLTTPNFQVLEIIYKFYLKENNIEKQTFKLLIEAISEYEESINEHDFFKTILYSRYVQEHLVHFIEERVKSLAKYDDLYKEIDVLIENDKEHSLGIHRASLPSIVNVFLNNNKRITGKFLTTEVINRIRKESHNLWKISSYFLHAGDAFVTYNHRLRNFNDSFKLIRVNGLKYIHELVTYITSVLYKDEWSDVMHILSSAPIEFKRLVKIPTNVVPTLFSLKGTEPVLKLANFRRKDNYEHLDEEQISLVCEEYDFPNRVIEGESKLEYFERVFKYFEAKFRESDDLYEKAIILRRDCETIVSNIAYFHEHFKGWREMNIIKDRINGLSHINYKHLEESKFRLVVPKDLNMETIDELHTFLIAARKKLLDEHMRHLEQQNRA